MAWIHGDNEGGGGQLYVVATPIGNLDDITLRALKVLAAVDFVAAEDTRVTARLLDHHGIRTRLISAREHNELKAAAAIVRALEAGQSAALVSDAGTPGVSDPGAQIVAAVREAGLRVVPVPGANAAVAAMSVAGLADEGFVFRGFLPPKAAARRKALESLGGEPRALVFYEAPHRILEAVDDLAEVLGGTRRILVARELTKLFESLHALPLGEAGAWLRADANRQRGEFVLVVEGAPASTAAADEADIERVLGPLLAALPLAQAVKLACEITGSRRNAVYELALRLKPEAP
jgi:16S rRNA (cytidine1402-2'-O)-methyltransferase